MLLQILVEFMFRVFRMSAFCRLSGHYQAEVISNFLEDAVLCLNQLIYNNLKTSKNI